MDNMTSAEGCRFKLHPELEKIFQTLERLRIPWCILRGEAELQTLVGDVDLLVDRTHFGSLRRSLAALGFVGLPVWGEGTHTFFFGHHQPSDSWIKLDIVTELSYGPNFALRTDAEADCLSRRCRDSVPVVLAPDDAFWTLLLHCLLDKGRIAPRHGERLQALVREARANGPLAQIVERARVDGWDAARVMTCVQRGEWAALAQLGPPLAARWPGRRHATTGWRGTTHRQIQLIGRASFRLSHRGLSVALLGPDGAGKSTLAEILQHSFCLPARSVYMGLWQRSTARTISPWVPGSDLATRLLRVWSGYLLARYHQALGRLVVFDRYPYDALLVPRRGLSWPGRFYFWMLGHACPHPDLVLLLDAPGSVMFERKGEHNPEILEEQRRAFLELQHHVPQLEIVDASRPKDVVQSDVVARIWRRYVAAWRSK